MSLPTIIRVTRFTKYCLTVLVVGWGFSSASGEWNIDLSRRVEKKRQVDLKQSPAERPTEATIFDWFVGKQQGSGPSQELVVLNTEKGFVPSTVRLREGGTYKIHVVNVNEKDKNVSFVMDSFSEHHSTYFGKIKSFTVSPKKEGVFSFVCPETSAQGRLVVYPPPGASVRRPASRE